LLDWHWGIESQSKRTHVPGGEMSGLKFKQLSTGQVKHLFISVMHSPLSLLQNEIYPALEVVIYRQTFWEVW
jgi:hypothetical protein